MHRRWQILLLRLLPLVFLAVAACVSQQEQARQKGEPIPDYAWDEWGPMTWPEQQEKLSRRKPVAPAEAIAILQKSDHRGELANAGVDLARAKDPEALDRLMVFVLDPKFWDRLDGKKEDRMERILIAIGKRATPKAEEALLKLASDKDFITDEMRKWGVIKACGELRQPSPKLLAFLDAKAVMKDGRDLTLDLSLAMLSLAKIGTPESVALYEKRLLSPDFKDRRLNWIWILVFHRHKPAVVDLLKRLLNSPLAADAELRTQMVFVLLDPMEWESSKERKRDEVPLPPPRTYASTEVLEEVLKIADVALKLDIAKDLKEDVLKEKKKIETILEFRRGGGSERIQRWIKDLDSDSFAVRDGAEHELDKVHKMAEPSLRRALASDPSAEARKRLERLLSQIPMPQLPDK